EVKKFTVMTVPAQKIGIVTAKFGKKITGDRFLALDDEIGIRKRVLGPGTYRLNPYGYTIAIANQTYIKAGNVGVLINSQKGGVEQGRVLPAGVHFINPKRYKVEVVPVGLNEYTLSSERVVKITDAMLRGEEDNLNKSYTNKNVLSGGEMLFPSKDGFNAGIDVTVLWELDPIRAISAVTKYGKVNELHDRVINPMLNSSARNEGSKYTAKELIQGDTRAKFQETFTVTLSDYTKNAPLKIVAALPRKIYVPIKIQLPIMQAQLKREQMLTNREIEETSKVEAKLEEQKKYIKQEIEQVKADTKVIVLSIRAETEKEVGEYQAETRLRTLKVDL
ncbi:SPFH domain-containing protein, partial [bacterium]|nr:SPFH domain-containing protein [bacterium]